jgi:hypothetical protein
MLSDRDLYGPLPGLRGWLRRGFNIRMWELILMCIIAGIGGAAFSSLFGG